MLMSHKCHWHFEQLTAIVQDAVTLDIYHLPFMSTTFHRLNTATCNTKTGLTFTFDASEFDSQQNISLKNRHNSSA